MAEIRGRAFLSHPRLLGHIDGRRKIMHTAPLPPQKTVGDVRQHHDEDNNDDKHDIINLPNKAITAMPCLIPSQGGAKGAQHHHHGNDNCDAGDGGDRLGGNSNGSKDCNNPTINLKVRRKNNRGSSNSSSSSGSQGREQGQGQGQWQ